MQSFLRLVVVGLLVILPLTIYGIAGTLYLWQQGYFVVIAASLTGLLSFAIAMILLRRWSAVSQQSVLPPLNWNDPSTFTPKDGEAWQMVKSEAERALDADALTEADTYIESGRRLFESIAHHYHPHADQPLDQVPLLQILTAIELAAEDLSGMVSRVPGSNLMTISRYKMAQNAANLVSRASEIYGYVLPLFNPAVGLARLGVSRGVTKPALQAVQKHVLQWLYQAYVNRLGMHLIELYSGRLAIGADQYRRISRRLDASTEPHESDRLGDETSIPIRIRVAAPSQFHERARGFQELMRKARTLDPTDLRDRLEGMGSDPALADRLYQTQVELAPEFPNQTTEEKSDRSWDATVESLADSELAIVLFDSSNDSRQSLERLSSRWERRIETQTDWLPPSVIVIDLDPEAYGDANGRSLSETALHLSPSFSTVLHCRYDVTSVAEYVMPTLLSRLPMAQQLAMHHRLHPAMQPSAASQVAGQLFEGAKSLLGQWGPLSRNSKKPNQTSTESD